MNNININKSKAFKHLLLITLLMCLMGFYSCISKTPRPKHTNCDLWNVKLEDANSKFVEDYIYLWDVLDNEYPFLSMAERITGKNTDKIKEQYYYKIEQCNTSKDFFVYVITPCLDEFRQIGHLCAFDNNRYAYIYGMYSENKDIKRMPTNFSNYRRMTSKKAREFYGEIIKQVNTELETNKKDDQKNSVIFNSENNLSFDYYPENCAAYVSINQMNTYESSDNTEYKELADFFKQIETEGYKNCIIDIRQNPGGSDTYWMYGVVKPNSSKLTSTFNYALVKGHVCQNYLNKVFQLQPIKDFPMNKLQQFNKNDLEGITNFIEIQRDYPYSEDGSPLFTGKIWLLVGKDCYSSCESFAMYCKQTGFATIVGTSTGGDGLGCSPLVLSLPNTGICIRFSSILTLNPDGSSNQEFGTAPDYKISEGEDALTKCISIINDIKKEEISQ